METDSTEREEMVAKGKNFGYCQRQGQEAWRKPEVNKEAKWYQKDHNYRTQKKTPLEEVVMQNYNTKDRYSLFPMVELSIIEKHWTWLSSTLSFNRKRTEAHESFLEGMRYFGAELERKSSSPACVLMILLLYYSSSSSIIYDDARINETTLKILSPWENRFNDNTDT